MLVLIVDDNPMMRVVLERAVTLAGVCEIDFVGNGAEALRCFRHRGHDLILLDLNMPQMSGTDFLTHLRDHPALDRAHVMMVTGAADKQLVAKIRNDRLKVDDLIVKPFDVAKLSRKIADVMARTQSRRRTDGPILKAAVPVPVASDATPSLVCSVIDRGDVAILELTGKFIQENLAVVNDALKAIQQLHAQSVVIDLQGVEVIDDSGLGHIAVMNGFLASFDRQCFIKFGKFPERDRVIALGLTHIVPIREPTDDPFDT